VFPGCVLLSPAFLFKCCCTMILVRLLREVVKSPSLEVFKNSGDVALRDMVSGHGGVGLVVQLDDLRGLFQP